MKGNVIAQGKVQKVLKDFVFAELWTDRTEWAAENSKLLKQRFRSNALPLYATLGANGVERSRLLGVATADEFIAFLKKGLDQTGKAHSTLEPALAEAQSSGKPVFVEFANVTNTTSLFMKERVLKLDSVDRLLKRFVLAELWTDRPDFGPQNRALQADRFRVTASPFYAVLSPEGQERSRLHGVVSEAEFVAFLEIGLGALSK